MEKFVPKDHIKVTLMIFTAMLGGLFVYAMIALFVTYGKKQPNNDIDTYLYIAVAAAFIAIIAGQLIAGSIIKNALSKDFETKLNAYRSAVLAKISLMEIAAIYSITMYILTANILLLVVAAVLVFLYRYTRPTPLRAAKLMKLSQKDAKQLM
ncbi:hypothetical protein ACE1ET_02715 [Saccharicrinis sp. FJH62]|uniref:hypothetical protein n=1 Tax=Saccharicrinis sp. FJH62 TaxID=3344657 RepID=UPI0035D4D18E